MLHGDNNAEPEDRLTCRKPNPGKPYTESEGASRNGIVAGRRAEKTAIFKGGSGLSVRHSGHHFAIVMLGTPTRGTSLTVIWNKRYSSWNPSRFQRASGPVVLTA